MSTRVRADGGADLMALGEVVSRTGILFLRTRQALAQTEQAPPQLITV